MNKDIKKHNKYFSDYLQQAKNTEDYLSRIREFLLKINITDYSVAQFDSNTNIRQHYQTAPDEMYQCTFNPSDCNLVGLQATKCPGKPVYLSDLEHFVLRDEFVNTLFSGFIHTFHTIKKFGYSDFYNIPISMDNNDTLLLSISIHDTTPCQIKQCIDKNKKTLWQLAQSIADSIPAPTRLIDKLKNREIDILNILSSNDYSISHVASLLSIEESTVNFHLKQARRRTGISKTHFLIAQALREKIIR